ncbi:MAG TPA: hypothetical protein VGP72_29765 [Planctomycetota bacterium]
MRNNSRLLLVVVLTLVISALQAGEKVVNTRTLVRKFGDDLAAAWDKFPLPNQKTVLSQTCTDLNTVFSSAIMKVDGPPNQTVKQMFRAYLDNVARVRELFKVEKMKQERGTYARGCDMALKREITFATDYQKERTTQQCFEMLMDFLEAAREEFIQDANRDLRSATYQQANNVFSEILRFAKFAPGIDYAVEMDNSVKAARIRFPTTTDALRERNGPAFQLCDSAARAIKQKSTQGR